MTKPMSNKKALELAIQSLRVDSRKLFQFKHMYENGDRNQKAGADEWGKINEAIEILQAMIEAQR